jgi:hypothetical protein
MRRHLGLILSVLGLTLVACSLDPLAHAPKTAPSSPQASAAVGASPGALQASPTTAPSPSNPLASPSASVRPTPVMTPTTAPDGGATLAPTPLPTLTPPPPPTPIPTLAPNGYTTTLYAGNGALLPLDPGKSPDPSNAAYADGMASAASFREPTSLVYDLAGNMIVGDYRNHAIRRIAADRSVVTLVGNPPPFRGIGHDDGKGTQAHFFHMCQIAVGPDGTLYAVEDWYQDIRVVAPDLTVTTLSGWPVAAGQPLPAELVDSFAGQKGGYADGDALHAHFNNPYGCVLAPNGKLYIGDTKNNCIREVTLPGGAVTTFAGNPNHVQADGSVKDFADGPATQALFNHPFGLAVDRQGNLYVADTYNNRIRKVAPDGSVTTVAGGDQGGFADGVGLQARLNGPMGVALDAKGRLLVADTTNERIRLIDLTVAGNPVTTLAGSGLRGYREGPALQATFDHPQAVLAGPLEDVFVADTENHRIRRIAK